MTFITTTQLRDALAPDGNVVGTAAELGEGQLTDAINEAQNKVSAYVGHVHRYECPGAGP